MVLVKGYETIFHSPTAANTFKAGGLLATAATILPRSAPLALKEVMLHDDRLSRTPTVRQGMEQVITKRRYYDIGLQIEELLYSGVFKAGERLPQNVNLASGLIPVERPFVKPSLCWNSKAY